MKIDLEDNYDDILGKAQRGLGLKSAEVAERSGVTEAEVRSVIGGEYDEALVRSVSPVLGLDADRVVAIGEGSYFPEAVSVEGVVQVNTPFEDMTVNAYLLWDLASRRAAVFDTGSDVTDLLAAADERDLTIERVFITHAHGDHIFDLDRLRRKTGVTPVTPSREVVDGAERFDIGEEFTIGRLSVETRLTCGHARGGVTYVVRGLAVPVAICGDAMFAGSMGGGMISYEEALKTNREEILSLEDETVLCPGHGPMTTVGEQRRCNPFFPEV
ncbi:MAG: MBL fold metallo-hydrolase [Chthoniobacterales bacterium]